MWSVTGHNKAVNFLERSLECGRLTHAYLFVGPRHIGKTTLALALAQALNCESEERPCGSCSSCLRIAAGKHPDVQLVGLEAEKKTEISIDQVREMQRSAGLPPFEGRFKVFIMKEVESLSLEGSNALLKLLEDALPHLVFILLAVSDDSVLPTVRSRCQLVQLRPLPQSVVTKMLMDGHDLTEERAEVLSRLSKGCPGWAILASTDKDILEERSDKVASLIDIIGADFEGRFSYAAELSQEFTKNRKYGDEILSLWLDWWRDVLLTKSGNGQSIINIDHQSDLAHQAEHCSLWQIKDFMRRLIEAREMIRQNVNSRLVLETLMLSMPRA